jgi:hypothetical protein
MFKRNVVIIPVFLLVGILLFFAARITYVHIKKAQAIFIPQTVHTVILPPKGALQAMVTTLQGAVKKEGRDDTDFHAISNPTSLREGESLSTGQDGSSTIMFENTINLLLQNNTELDFLTGLPSALVVRQPQGTITYTVTKTIEPFSVRSLGLLIQLTNQSTVIIDTDSVGQTVDITVNNGTATVAYSDVNDNIQVKKLTEGQEVLFDNTKFTLTSE